MKNTLGLVGLPEAALNCSGFGGPIGLPERVRKAKLTYSVPPRIWFRHVELSTVPATGSSDRLSMFSAAHQSRGSQLWLLNCLTQPGGQDCNPVNAAPACWASPERRLVSHSLV